MNKVITFPNLRKKIGAKFADILAEVEREQAQSKAGSVAYAFLIVSLLCTVASYNPLSIFAAMAVLPIGTLYFAICYKHPFLFIRKSFATLVSLVVPSVASGCSAGFTYNPIKPSSISAMTSSAIHAATVSPTVSRSSGSRCNHHPSKPPSPMAQ